MPTEQDATLIEALRSFIRTAHEPEPPASQIRLSDAVWLLLLFACISLALGLLPATWLTSERGKFAVDKVIPWFLSLGAVSAIIKSPDTVLGTTRNWKFRWCIGVVFVLLLSVIFPAFEVRPAVGSGVAVYVDGVRRFEQFHLALGPHQVELRPGNQRNGRRQLQLRTAAFFHGLVLRPDWRLLYKKSIEIKDPQLAICFEPQRYEFDQDFIEENKNLFRRIGPKAAEYLRQNDGGFDLQLPSGTYQVTAYQVAGCIAQTTMDVGPYAAIQTKIPSVVCTTAAPHSPCDQLLPTNA